MSAQNIAEAFCQHEALYRASVMADTWGHLAAKKHKTYRGWILFAIPAYDSGTPCIIESEFKGLDDSPWLYDAMWDFCADRNTVPHDENGLNAESGVYRFVGSIRNYEFKGTIAKLGIEGAL